MKIATIPLLMLPLLAACGSGGSGGSSGSPGTPPTSVIAPTPTPAPPVAPVPTPTPPATTVPAPTTRDVQSGLAATYAVRPDVPACQTGTLASGVANALLAQINAIRALHQLPPAAYSPSDEPAAMASALMMAANQQLSHTPPASWTCYTAAGASGAATSNLYLVTATPNAPFPSDDFFLEGFMTEVGNASGENVGHRRWLLNPFLGSLAYGRVTDQRTTRFDAASIKVFSNAGPAAPITNLPAFVAYPYGDYPAWLFDPSALFSFQVVADRTTSGGANATVDFSRAAITVRQRSTGASLAISRIAFDNQGFGLPNNIQWRAADVQSDTQYDVSITGVLVRGVATNYDYAFRILPSTSGQRAMSADTSIKKTVMGPRARR